MRKTILITGATDGLGRATAAELVAAGHCVLLHGRSPAKLADLARTFAESGHERSIATYQADLSVLTEVTNLAASIAQRHQNLDVLINNAGVLRTRVPTTTDGLDVRFVVNSVAPFHLTQSLRPLLGSGSRVVNLSSAAQAPVNLQALAGEVRLDEMEAYAQSKLALTMWTHHVAEEYAEEGPEVYAVNPGSFLATKMVKEGFGMAGHDIGKGVDVVLRASTSTEFAGMSGKYFDNDSGGFSHPHPDALNAEKCRAVVQSIKTILAQLETRPSNPGSRGPGG